ncbi:MAG: nucleotidyl transferase AbiEii/AbiGii toxin family protein [Paludibacter sp.]|jgi:predicted nucleotidyltransferase component of viral defense system|nr:nucleotidyl transferase AbiEii/AbiGii toxin family protein [Paludibacter sp.]
MNLHENKVLFLDLIHDASEILKIDEVYIEKDYWITRSLKRMARNTNTEKVVFKGGTSLSKAYCLTNRFSEDIDIAVIDADSFSGNQLKILIKRLAKDMAEGLEENVVQGVTSKGSRFYKAIYLYPQLTNPASSIVNTGQLLIEINTYANPYPYIKQEINSFIYNYLTNINRNDLIEKYGLQPFSLNVLDKRRTMIEKLISLFRFSFSENPQIALAAKIRHFYDLYFLVNDTECAAYIQTANFKTDFAELLEHDKQEFDTPAGWTEKDMSQSPLVTEFPVLWNSLRDTYLAELPKLAFVPIPNEKETAKEFEKITEQLTRLCLTLPFSDMRWD